MKTILYVPFEEKDEAKRLGARWDPAQRVWYVQNVENLEQFNRWLEPKRYGFNWDLDKKLQAIIKASSEKNAVWLKSTKYYGEDGRQLALSPTSVQQSFAKLPLSSQTVHTANQKAFTASSFSLPITPRVPPKKAKKKKKPKVKSMHFRNNDRPCWKCGGLVAFRPTPRAPKGAWVDSGSQEHHRCSDPIPREQINHLRSILA